MADGERRLGRRAVVAVLAVFAVPPVTLLLLAGTGLALPGELVFAVVALPLLAVGGGLAVIARQVASSPDEPELVERHVAERVGMTSEEYEELLER